MLIIIAAAFAESEYAQEAKSRMKLSFDLDEVEAELNAPAPAAQRPTRGQVPVVAPLPLEPNSTLDHVTVLRDRAIVTRSRELKLTAGTQRLRFEGLPLGLDPSTLYAELRGGDAKVVGVELVSGRGDVEETEAMEQVKAKAKELSAQLGQVADRLEAALMQRAYLRNVLLPTGEVKSAPTLDTVKGTLGWVGEAEQALAARLRADEDRAAEFGEDLEPLLLKLRNPLATGNTVRVDLELEKPGTVTVALRYGVAGASWAPAYAARLDPTTNTVTLETQAVVTQWTQEAWTNAAIELSTAAPVVGGAAPMLSPWILDERGVNAGSLVVSGAEASGAGARVFAVSGRRTIAGDGSEARIPIQSQAAPTTLSLSTVPRVTPEVFRTAAVTWTGESPLLPGEVASFVGGDYVGSATIPAIAPGEPMALGFGVDDRVRVERKLAERKVEHLLGGRTRYTVKHRTVVRNFAKVAQVVRLADQAPVSQVDRITVVTLEPSMAASTAPDAPVGVSEWSLTVPAGGEVVLETGFVVTAPKELSRQLDQMMM